MNLAFVCKNSRALILYQHVRECFCRRIKMIKIVLCKIIICKIQVEIYTVDKHLLDPGSSCFPRQVPPKLRKNVLSVCTWR